MLFISFEADWKCFPSGAGDVCSVGLRQLLWNCRIRGVVLKDCVCLVCVPIVGCCCIYDYRKNNVGCLTAFDRFGASLLDCAKQIAHRALAAT